MHTTAVMWMAKRRPRRWEIVVFRGAVSDDTRRHHGDADDSAPERDTSTRRYRSRSTISLASPFYAVLGSADELPESAAPEYWSPPPPSPIGSERDARYRLVRDRVGRAYANDDAEIRALLTAFNASLVMSRRPTSDARTKPSRPRPPPSYMHGEAARLAELWRSCDGHRTPSWGVIGALVTIADLERRMPPSTVYIDVTPYAAPRPDCRSHAYVFDRYFYDDVAFGHASHRYVPARIDCDMRDCNTRRTEPSAADLANCHAFSSREHLDSLACQL